eukprot:CAMPEP_0184308616 /NCGR_PEP_ID=MMETSP1049-20130417/17020_1 /TAXON_ID=77928 /ORGANISM="Proteomonas sulcata, Strain CCMP704" /LENGTH=272 /DNA_ID=CAMNT_0026621331 /DNA_START=120 /DNA_END=939 /DNA_ORIENTATION=+
MPDPVATIRVLSLVKARITAEMENFLGDDAWAAQLLARLLQVDQIPIRMMALETAMGEMGDNRMRAKFFDVVDSTMADLKELEVTGQSLDPELLPRVTQIRNSIASRLGLKETQSHQGWEVEDRPITSLLLAFGSGLLDAIHHCSPGSGPLFSLCPSLLSLGSLPLYAGFHLVTLITTLRMLLLCTPRFRIDCPPCNVSEVNLVVMGPRGNEGLRMVHLNILNWHAPLPSSRDDLLVGPMGGHNTDEVGWVDLHQSHDTIVGAGENSFPVQD